MKDVVLKALDASRKAAREAIKRFDEAAAMAFHHACPLLEDAWVEVEHDGQTSIATSVFVRIAGVVIKTALVEWDEVGADGPWAKDVEGKRRYAGYFGDLDDPRDRAVLGAAVQDWKVFIAALDAWVDNHPRGVMRPSLVSALTER